MIFCRCNITYRGRIDAQLELGDRLIVIKDCGAVLVHAGAGLMPRNWMPTGTTLAEITPGRHWRFSYHKRDEDLDVYIDTIYSDVTHPVVLSGPLIKTGVEREMCELLVQQMERIEPGLELVGREFATPVGPIDILAKDPLGLPVVVEVKRQRVSGAETVYQVLRYLDALEQMPGGEGVRARGILVGPGLARTVGPLLAKHHIGFVRLAYKDLDGAVTPRSPTSPTSPTRPRRRARSAGSSLPSEGQRNKRPARPAG